MTEADIKRSCDKSVASAKEEDSCRLSDQITKQDTINAAEAEKTRVKSSSLNLHPLAFASASSASTQDKAAQHDTVSQASTTNKGDIAADANRIQKALVEREQWGRTARSNSNCEKDIRDTISTLNSAQIAELDQTYKFHYGKPLKEVLVDGPQSALSQETKDSLAIYLKGSDKRTTADTLALANIATKAGNIEMFQETFRDASAEARQQYVAANNHGLDKMEDAFAGIFSDSELEIARDYLKNGQLSADTGIKLNSSWSGDNELAIDSVLKNMSASERASYQEGKKLSNQELTGQKLTSQEQTKLKLESTVAENSSPINSLPSNNALTDKQQESLDYYTKTKATLDDAGNEREVARWEDKIATKGGGLVSQLAAHGGKIDDNIDSFLSTIENMSKEDWSRLKSEPAYRIEVEKVLAIDLSQPEMERAKGVLSKKLEADSFDQASLEQDIVSKLNMHAADTNTDEAQVIADIEAAFNKDPSLRERLNNPQTEEDKQLASDFKTAVHLALNNDEYATYAKPLLESGRLSIDVKAQLYHDTFEDNEEGLFKAIQNGTTQDWKNIQAQPEQALSFLSKEEQAVAINVAKQQGLMAAEDTLRAAILGAGTDVSKIKETLASLEPKQIEQTKTAYEQKYGSKLNDDLESELSGSDKSEILWMTRSQPVTAREAYNQSRDEVYKSADGIGKLFVSSLWDGSAELSTDRLNQYTRAMVEQGREGKELSVETQKQLGSSLTEALDLYKKSEGAAADAVVNGAVIAVGIGTAGFTGGVSLSLLTYVGAAGAVAKVGTKAAIMGADYDLLSAQAAQDAATGAINAALVVFGPVQAARLLRMGDETAAVAATNILVRVDKIAADTGIKLLKEGSEETLKMGLRSQVVLAIANGSDKVDEHVIAQLAQNIAASADDILPVKELITKNLAVAVQNETANVLKATLRQTALNSGAGGSGGAVSGTVDGISSWDSSAGFSKNISMVGEQALFGGLSGAGTAGGMTLGFKALGTGFHGLSNGLQRLERDSLSRVNLDLGNSAGAGAGAGIDLDDLSSLFPRQLRKSLRLFVPQTKMMFVDDASTFSLGTKEIGDITTSKNQFILAREFKPSDDVLTLYTDLFPAHERLPVAELTKNVENGTMALHVSRSPSGQATAFSVVSTPNPAHNLKSAHLDYLGVNPAIQSKGLGSSHMRDVNQWIESTFPDVPSTTFFIESRSLENLTMAQAYQTERRAAFYSKLGAEQVGYPKGSWAEGEAPVELWAFRHGQGPLNRNQAVVDGQRRFRDEFVHSDLDP